MVFTTSPPPSASKVPTEEELQQIEQFATVNEEVDNFFMHLLIDIDFSERAFDGIVVDESSLPFQKKAKMSHKVRRRLRHFGNSSGAAKIVILADRVAEYRPCAKVSPIPHENANTWMSTNVKKGLFATRDIRAGEFILSSIEAYISTPEDIGRNMHGLILPKIVLFDGLQRDFSYYEVVEAPSYLKRKRNSSGFLKRRMLCGFDQEEQQGSDGENSSQKVKYDSDAESSDSTEFGKYVFCIDFSCASEEARSIRKNCEPNCSIRYVVLNQRIFIFITATYDVKQGDELTLPHDFDYYYSNKIVQCAHPLDTENVCKFEKSRQLYYKKYFLMLDEKKRIEKEQKAGRLPKAPTVNCDSDASK